MYNYPFLDFNALNNEMNNKGIKSSQKLPFMYEKMNGKFYDDEKNIMKGAVVGITAIGSFPVELSDTNKLMLLGHEVTIEQIKEQLNKTIGMSAFMSYLNPKNKSLDSIAETTLDLKHYSVLHTVNLSIAIVGLSSGVEHEFSSQRDIVHLSRLTVAKTKTQGNPCLVLRNYKYYDMYKEILKNTKNILEKIEEKDNETENLLFPTAKASSIIITGSLKNILKLISLKDAGGKEDEFIEILEKIEGLVKEIYPELLN